VSPMNSSLHRAQDPEKKEEMSKKSWIPLIAGVFFAFCFIHHVFSLEDGQRVIPKRRSDMGKRAELAMAFARKEASTPSWARLYYPWVSWMVYLGRILPLQDGGFTLWMGGGTYAQRIMLSPTGEIEQPDVLFPTTDAKPTQDGGWIGTGITSDLESSNLWVEKFFSTGKIEWSYVYTGTLSGEKGMSIQQTSDGGYIVLGVSTGSGFVRPEFIDPIEGVGCALWVIKLLPDGSIQWQRSYGGLHIYDFLAEYQRHTIVETPDQGFAICATTEFYGHGLSDIWLIKLTHNGDIEWQKVYGGQGKEWLPLAGPHLQVTKNGFQNRPPRQHQVATRLP
jgi:hypothetical protein